MKIIGNLTRIIVVLTSIFLALSLSSCGSKVSGNEVPEYSWSLQYPTDLRLYDIVALDADHVWAVGELGTILFYDGDKWTKQESGTDKDLVSVSGVQPSVVWSAGHALDRSSPFPTAGEGIILSYKDGVWVEKERPKYNNANGPVFGVAVGDETHVWLGGEVIWFWDGVTFNMQMISTCPYYVLLALSPTYVWVCSKSGPAYYDGNEWTTTGINKITPRKKLREGGYPIQSFTSFDEEHIWAVGYQGNIFFFDGNEWTYQNSGTEKDLIDVEAIDAEHVWATGDGGVLFYDGKKWSTVKGVENYGFTYITASDNDHIWAIGEGGIYFGTPAGE